MKCMSCGVEIDPKFVHSIRSNVCAGCGGPLMTDSSQELMASLKDALLQMPNDPEGLAVWLLSNYDMRKVGSGEPVQRFYGTEAKYSNSGNYEDESKLKIRDNPLNKFYKNAGIDPASKSECERKKKQAQAKMGDKNLAGIAQAIQSGEEYIDSEDFEDFDPNDISNEDFETDFGESTVDYSHLMNQASKISGNIDPNRYIQEERIKRLQKQQELSSGSVGLIKRADV